MDQNLPGNTPQLFAPSVVNTAEIEINTVFNSSFTELFFTRIVNGSFIIYHSELVNNSWSKPNPIQMFDNKQAKSVAIDPTITKEGDTMYFLGVNPEDHSNSTPPDIYSSQKVDGKWQIATRVEFPISTDEYAESYPVVVADGSLYFESDRPGGFGKRDIYRAQYLEEGMFDIPVNIGPAINSEKSARSTFVASDESFLITSNITEEKGFFIAFKTNNEWQTPTKFELGELLDDEWIYFCPYMSPDNKFFFFSKRYNDPAVSGWKGVTRGEVYWLEAGHILDLNTK
ncbi:MAG: hypothetical protein ABJF11_16770 [Reichenbachiella sp.]|uniref:hypothetical protein n=1 Tax=Reichenbachiella sp. TaxID=2184521 RepID=UPI00326427E2